MAQVPKKSEVKRAQKQSQAEIDKKIAEQQAEGKDFVPTRAGVIPEEVWQARKVQS